MVNYFIRFSLSPFVSFEGGGSPLIKIILIEAENDEEAKTKFADWCKKNSNDYDGEQYVQKPCLVRFEILAKMEM